MKKAYRLLLLMAFLLPWGASVAQTSSATPKPASSIEAYGILLFDQGAQTNRIVKFDLLQAGSFETLYPLGSTYVSAASCIDGKYYMATVGILYSKADRFMVYDIENNTLSTVGYFSGFDNKIADMSYDYSTNTLYAISGNIGSVSALYTIDPESGNSAKIADLNDFFFTLACTYSGQLYGISKYGNFCRINKQTGAVDIIGDTEIDPSTDNSMEFNHTDKTLYWTASTVNDSGFVCIIDTLTGKASRIGTLGSMADASVAGLYIPFSASADNTPAAVSNLHIAPDPNGACQATLTWTNPTKLFGGSDIEGNIRIDIFRNDILIESIEDASPGSAETYTDVIPETTGLMCTYTITPANSNGNGVSTTSELFVGEDRPAKPDNLKAEKTSSDAVRISWDAPQQGENQGYIDQESLVYKIIRQPDNLTLDSNFTATSFADENIGHVNTYTYKVIPSTRIGEGLPAISNSVVAGPVLGLPYSCNFESDEQVSTWTIVNANNDDRLWEGSTYDGGCMSFNGGYNKPEPSDDWLISHDMELKAGHTYKGTFAARGLKSNKLRIYLGQGNDVADMNILLKDMPDLPTSSSFTQYEYTFSVQKDGVYNIGFQLYSDGNSSYFYLTDITIEQMAEINLQAIGLNGPKYPVAENAYPYQVGIRNNGSTDISTYTILLKDNLSNDTLQQETIHAPLASGKDTLHTIQWTPLQKDTIDVVAEVHCNGDEIAADNLSDPLHVEIQPAGSADFIEIGTIDEDKFNKNYLFNIYYKNSAALNIYTASDMGREDGWIEEFIFTVSNGNSSATQKIPVQIYMGNTQDINRSSWIPRDSLLLVFDDSISFSPGLQEVRLPLQKKFYWKKGYNLAILTTHAMESGYYNSITYPYFATNDESGAYYWTSDYENFSFSQYGSRAWQQKACISLVLRSNGATLCGIVKDRDGHALPGTALSIEERQQTVYANDTGYYAFHYLPDGEYTLKVSALGYEEHFYHIAIDQQDISQDITLSPFAMYPVSGRILSKEGKGIANALIQISGYENKNTLSDESGYFNFNQVYAVNDEYTLSVSADWFETTQTGFTVSDTAVSFDSLQLEYQKYPPVNVKAVIDSRDESVSLYWQDITERTEFKTENGRQQGDLGISNAGSNTILGTIYREPMEIEGLSWFLTSNGGPHYFIDVYVFALDSAGNPTNQILYQAEVRNNDNQFTSIKLEETVTAHHGCLVALGYEGYLGIGTSSPQDLAYPFLTQTHVFAADYRNGEFDYIETRGYQQNLMIRANGHRLADNREKPNRLNQSPYPDFCQYRIWRFPAEHLRDTQQWQMICSGTQDTSFVDHLAGNEIGRYMYAVSTLYPDGSISSQQCSQVVLYDMLTDITIHVKSNSKSEKATGASISLTGKNYGFQLAAIVDSNGIISFNKTYKDIYVGEITLDGYESLSIEEDFTEEDNYEAGTYLLKEIIIPPFNLDIAMQEDSSYLFSWNTSNDIFEGFEQYEDFAIDPSAKNGWTYWDMDKSLTFGFENVQFPGMTSSMAYLVFNPSETLPAIDTFANGIVPHDGKKLLASFASIEGNNDDWIISPELNFVEDFRFSFFAASYNAYPSIFSVGYTEISSPSPEDFTWIKENIEHTSGWQEFSYIIPASAKHVCIRNISTPDGFIFMLDNLQISKGIAEKGKAPSIQKPEFHFEVFLDGQLITSTEETVHVFANLAPGEHRAGVRSVYHSGESEILEIDFGTPTRNKESRQSVQNLSIYPNPAKDIVNFSAPCSWIGIYSLQGQQLCSYTQPRSQINIASIPAGTYLIRAIGSEGTQTYTAKIIVIK